MIGKKAGERAVRRVNPGKVETGRATVVYDPRIATSLVGHLSGAINGAAIARKTSFLKDKLGTRIFSAKIQITDDPTRPRGLASRPFDGEGVSAEPLFRSRTVSSRPGSSIRRAPASSASPPTAAPPAAAAIPRPARPT